MAVVEDGLHGLQEALRDCPAGQESRLDVLFLQNPQQPVDRMVWSVSTLAPHFVIENAILVRLTSSPPWKSKVRNTAARSPRGLRRLSSLILPSERGLYLL